MTCQDVMTANPTSCPSSAGAVEAAQIMRDEDVGSVPVIDEGTQKLVGMVTDRDLCLEVVAEGRDPVETTIGDCMSGMLITCRPEDDLQEAERLMQEHQIRRIPVVDQRGYCIGIVSQADLALKANQPEEVHETVRRISEPPSRKAA